MQMNANSLLRRTGIIRPRIQKSQEAQAERTRKKAEVFTPAWLCNKMNNNLDEDWFGRKDVFNTENEDHTWTIRAFEASYGCEYQGDNVLIARINLLLTFVDYYEERWERQPDEKLLQQIANKIAWNIWQMDGLKGTVPLGKPYEEFRQLTIFEMMGIEDESENAPEAVLCKVFNWRGKSSLKFMDLKEI